MNEGTRKIIAVTPEESSLVRAGTVIMDDAMARKKKSEEEAGAGIEPLLLFNSKAEANVVCEVDTLSRKYQKELGLREPPILVAELPAEPSATTSSHTGNCSTDIYAAAHYDAALCACRKVPFL